jgi:hypothetical protein
MNNLACTLRMIKLNNLSPALSARVMLHDFSKNEFRTVHCEKKMQELACISIINSKKRTSHCSLNTVYYPLFTAHCPRFTAHWPFFIGHCLLPLVHTYCLLPTAHCSLPTAPMYCPLSISQCLLPIAHCPLSTAHGALPSAHCPLTTVHYLSAALTEDQRCSGPLCSRQWA